MEINKHMEQTPLERRPSSMQVTTGFGPERERFEKEQIECISKAIKAEECAAKEKHVRRTIIGTWQERGTATFWNTLGKMPLPSQNVMCWKALTVLHKILREGHPNCLKDSYVFKRTLKDLYSVYRFATSLYGQLIGHYLRALQCKLEFHHRYPKIPGSLVFTDENPFKMPYRDINDIFHFAVEAFDFQDLMLTLEEEVIKTVDKSKNSSQMHAVQCRIAPLVAILKECSGLFDIIRYVMVKLHKSLPPDTLSGHRSRFNNQFSRLKTFIQEASSFAYITALTSIPKLPDSPPNFLIHTMEPKPKPKPIEEKPSTPILPQKDDRDFLIEQLMREINELQAHLDYMERNALATQDGLKTQIMQLKEDLSQYKRIAEQACDENVFLKSQLEGFTHETKEDDVEKEKVNEMFNKLKQKYTGLRDEHVKMIRQNAELKRKAETAAESKEDIEKTIVELQAALNAKDDDIRAMQENLDQIENINMNTHDSLEQLEKEKNATIDELTSRLSSINEKLENFEDAKAKLESELDKSRRETENQVKVLQAQLEHMTSSKLTQEDARKSAEDFLDKLKNDQEAVREKLENDILRLQSDAEMEKAAKETAEVQAKQLQEQLDSQVSELKKQLEKLAQERLEQEQAKKATEAAMESLKSSSGGELAALATSLQESTKEKNDLLAKKEELSKEIENLKAQQQIMNNDYLSQIGSLQDTVSQQSTSKEMISREMEKLRLEHQTKIEDLSREINAVSVARSGEESAKKELESRLMQEKTDNEAKLNQHIKDKRADEVASRYALIASTVMQCEQILRDTVEQFQNPLHLSGTTCTAEYLKTRLQELPKAVDSTTMSYNDFRKDENDVTMVLSNLTFMTHTISESLLHGKATSHMASHEDSEEMTYRCKVTADASFALLGTVKERHCDQSKVMTDAANLKSKISGIIDFATLLIPKEADNLDVGDLVDEQIGETAQLVADASARIEEMLRKSREKHTGVQLEVNERILDSCNGLMKAIRELILKSKDLQDEIVLEGRGTASAKEFYKRHHKWTEGLLSAAKSVGWGASILVDAADKVVERKGKFEELVVASNEIAASTAQLVAASRVKATKGSEKLGRLMTASKKVGECTANVVATVKSGAEMTEDAKTVPDYSKLTLTQAKRLEMDSQVRMLELETLLEKERQKLGRLRKAHYQIASELGLLEEDDDS